MRIAFASTVGGGVDPYVKMSARYLTANGHSVHVLYPRQQPEWHETFPNLYLHTTTTGRLHYYAARLGLKGTRFPLMIRQYETSVGLARTLKAVRAKYGLDLVELIEGFAYPRLFDGIPFVYKMHGAAWTFNRYCEDQTYYRFQIENQRKMLLAARQVQSISRSQADFIAGACDVPARLIRVIPYAIDIQQFRPASPPAPEPPFHLMSVGRLEKRKGTHTLVRALRTVWQQEPDTHLHLYGHSRDFGQIQIEAEIPPEEHQGRIHFEGFVPRSDLITAYQKTHIYVSPTRYETFGYTLLEALACGRPVIAADIGPVPELVRHEENGWLVPRDDVESLAQAIVRGLRESDQREANGRAGREFAERFAVERIMPKQIALYESALNG